MGASVSTNTSAVNNDFSSQEYATCGNTVASNTIDIHSLKYTQPPGCPADSKGFLAQQTSAVKADCVIGILQQNVADTVSKMNADAQAGLGFAVSTDSSNISNQIKNKISASCGDKSSTNQASISDTEVTACNLAIIQDASAQSSCAINTLQAITSNVQSTQDTSAKGGSLFGDLFGGMPSWIWIIIGIVVLLILAGAGFGLYRHFSGKKGKTTGAKKKITTTTTKKVTPGEEIFDLDTEDAVQIGGLTDLFSGAEGTFWDRVKRNKSLVVIIILLLLLIAVYFFNKRIQNKPPITEEDLDDLKQKIMEAQQVASMDNTYVPSAPPSPQYIATQDEIIGNNYDARYSDHAYNQTLDDYYKPLLE